MRRGCVKDIEPASSASMLLLRRVLDVGRAWSCMNLASSVESNVKVCQGHVSRLRRGCVEVASRLQQGRIKVASRLRRGCVEVASRLNVEGVEARAQDWNQVKSLPVSPSFLM